MNKTISGSIISTDLGVMGTKRYGFIGIETDDKERLKIKVAAYTECETIEIGEHVLIEAESLGDKGMWTAKKITRAV